jgi:hypothetical protein
MLHHKRCRRGIPSALHFFSDAFILSVNNRQTIDPFRQAGHCPENVLHTSQRIIVVRPSAANRVQDTVPAFRRLFRQSHGGIEGYVSLAV